MQYSRSTKYQHCEWKVEPHSVFEYDPLEEGIESISLGHLRNNARQTVYEGYGRRDMRSEAEPQTNAKVVKFELPVSWSYEDQSRWPKNLQPAEGDGERVYSGIKVNGIPLDMKTLKLAKSRKSSTKYHWNSDKNDDEAVGRLNESHVRPVEAKDITNIELTKDNEGEVSNETRVKSHFVATVPLQEDAVNRIYSPKPFLPNGIPHCVLDEPKHNDFNRSPTPFTATYS